MTKLLKLDTGISEVPESLQRAFDTHMEAEPIGYALVTIHKDGDARLSYGHGGNNLYYALLGAVSDALGAIE